MREYRPQSEKSAFDRALQRIAQTRLGGILLHTRGARTGQEAWSVVCDNYTGYAVYQRRAGSRESPVVALRPRPALPPRATR